jgi:hypothetical protein
MSADLGGWIGHPVTLGLGAAVVAALYVVLEVLLSNLGEMGNVRFQGILDENPGLFPGAQETPLRLADLLDALRWLQLASVGLLWFVLLQYPRLTGLTALGLSLGVVAVLALVSRLPGRSMTEDTVVKLLRLVRPLARLPVAVMRPSAPASPAGAAEDDEE